MKNKIKVITITITTFMLLMQLAITMHAQVRESILLQRADMESRGPESEILRAGNVNYLRTAGGLRNGNEVISVSTVIERAETKDLKGKSYEYVSWASNREYGIFMNDLFRSVFSKERAKQLENMRIGCSLIISPAADNKITHIQFGILGNDNENFPLQLSELYELEQRIRAEPKAVPQIFEVSGKVVDYGAMWSRDIIFNRLYE